MLVVDEDLPWVGIVASAAAAAAGGIGFVVAVGIGGGGLSNVVVTI